MRKEYNFLHHLELENMELVGEYEIPKVKKRKST